MILFERRRWGTKGRRPRINVSYNYYRVTAEAIQVCMTSKSETETEMFKPLRNFTECNDSAPAPWINSKKRLVSPIVLPHYGPMVGDMHPPWSWGEVRLSPSCTPKIEIAWASCMRPMTVGLLASRNPGI